MTLPQREGRGLAVLDRECRQQQRPRTMTKRNRRLLRDEDGDAAVEEAVAAVADAAAADEATDAAVDDVDVATARHRLSTPPPSDLIVRSSFG